VPEMRPYVGNRTLDAHLGRLGWDKPKGLSHPDFELKSEALEFVSSRECTQSVGLVGA
jgi:hypothetical protein